MTAAAPAPARRRTSLRSASVPYPTIDLIKKLLGIDDADTSQDAAIEAILNACLAMIESYCGRTFQEGDYTEEFAPIDARDSYLMLRAWPVSTVATVTRDEQVLTGWRLYPSTGMLLQQEHGRCWCHHWQHDHSASVIVEYTGGYPPDAWPADLVDILLRLFSVRWNGSGGNVTNETGAAGRIKGFTVDAMRIDYDVGDAAAGATQGVEAGEIPPDLAPFAAQLQPYVDQRVYGI